MDALQEKVERAIRELAPDFGLEPALIEILSTTDGIASIRFGQGCVSCPAGLPSLIMGLESELRQRVPEIELIEAVM